MVGGFALVLFSAIAASFVAVALLRQAGYDIVRFQAALFVGHWTPLSERTWVRASSGWVAFGNTGTPKTDESFIETPLLIGSQQFDRGIGAFAPSEVVYDLEPSDELFRATIGINHGGPLDEGSATFSVFLDDVSLYRSKLISAGQPGQEVTIPLTTRGRLRLVAEPGSTLSPWNLATWGDARVLQSTATFGVPQELGIAIQAARQRATNAFLRDRAEKRLLAETSRRHRAVEDLFGIGDMGAAEAAFNPDRDEWVIANQQIAVALGVGAQSPGRISIVRRQPTQLILDQSTSSVEIGGKVYRLTEGTAMTDGVEPARVNVPGFGPGIEVTIPFAFADGAQIQASVIVLDESPAFLYQLQPTGTEGDSGATYEYLGGANAMLLGDRAQYLTDVSRIRSGSIRGDGLARSESIDFGKPLVFSGGALGAAVLLATVDETDLMSDFVATLRPGQIQADIRYRSRRSRALGPAPRLYLEVTGETQLRQAFGRYREAMAQIYPSRAPPSWLRYQWSTWYVYFMGVSDAGLRAQIDYISKNLADLGPWHVVIDAGWYVAEGEPNSGFQTVDRNKFPEGIRSVVDYAHARGIKVALYLSVPYLDSRQQLGDWLGLRGVIDNYRACLTVLGSDSTGTSYAFDFDRSCTRQYWQSVLNDYFTSYDVDGLIVDGLGFAEGAKVSSRRLDPVGIVDRVAQQTVDIYRFMYETASQLKSDIYLEGGWHFPMMAKPYATSFWLSDSTAKFSNPYPFTGLVEAIEYAAFQRVALGQPSHMGWITDQQGNEQLNRWRIEAALALAGLTGDGTNLLELTPQRLAALRARLVHLRPFEGQTFVDDLQRPTVFGTVRDDLAFIGMLNRAASEADTRAQLADFGLSPSAAYTVYSPEDDTAQVVRGSIAATLPGKSFRLSVVPLKPGVVWTDSSYEQRLAGEALTVTLAGPPGIPGFVLVYAPSLRAVTLDGRPLAEDAPGPLGRLFPGEYQYDASTGMLRVRYEHEASHVLSITMTPPSP
jgi:hypothetical protein